MSAITITIGPGELLDRCTILDLKIEYARCAQSRSAREDELAALADAREALCRNPQLAALEGRLAATNRTLWDLEDTLRVCERAGRFDATFINTARRICQTNDVRAALKAQVDGVVGYTGSDVKVYAGSAKI